MIEKVNKFWQKHYAFCSFASFIGGATTLLFIRLKGVESLELSNELIIALATLVLAIFTWLLWHETAKNRHYNQSAHIVVSLEAHKRHTNAIELVVENVGNGIAKMAKIRVLKKNATQLNNTASGRKALDDIGLFQHPIPLLKSGSQMRHFAFQYQDLAEPEGFELQIEVEWIDYRNEKILEQSLLTLNYMIGQTNLGKDPIVEIAQAQQKISQTLSRSVKGNKVQIDTYDQSDRHEERQQLAELRTNL